MKRKQRLRKNHEFKRVYQHGKSKVAPNTVIYYHKNGQGFNRLGVSISKKVGKSVLRHRLKRLYSEAFYRLRDNVEQGYDIVIVARKNAGELRFAEILKEIDGLLKRGKIII